MRCCIIGGSGFIGHYLIQELIASGREVVVVDRHEPNESVRSKVDYISHDYGNIQMIKDVLHDCHEIVDLAYATVPQTSFVDPLFDLQANLPPCIGLLEASRDLHLLKKLLVVSSGGTVYGPVEKLPIVEDTPAQPVSPYGITKLTIERYALMFYRLHGVPVTIVRPANAYGVGQRPFVGQGFIATAMGHILRGEAVVVYGESGTVRDYVHVSDVARGILATLTHGNCGEVYNLGSGVGRNNLQVLDIIEQLAAKAGVSVRVRNEPERHFDVPANVLNFGKLLACSGWSPKVAFEDGVKEMWNSFVDAE